MDSTKTELTLALLSFREREVSGHISLQCLPCTAAMAPVILWLDGLVGLRVVSSKVSSLLQPVSVAVILLLAKVVECTAGGDHLWCKGKVKVASFQKNPPPRL